MLLCRSTADILATTATQLRSKGQAEGIRIVWFFQLNHYDKLSYSESNTGRGNCFNATVSYTKGNTFRVHVSHGIVCTLDQTNATHANYKQQFQNLKQTLGWLKKIRSCVLTKTISAFFQNHTQSLLYNLFIWGITQKNRQH